MWNFKKRRNAPAPALFFYAFPHRQNDYKDMAYPTERNGYIYSRGTKAGFLRLQRQGIPRPLFALQDKLAKEIEKRFNALIKNLLRSIKSKAMQGSITLDSWDDELEYLEKYFKEMYEKAKKQEEEAAEIANRANMQTLANNLYAEWFDDEQEEIDRLDEFYTGELGDDLRPAIENIFSKEQKDYMKRFFDDADEKMQRVVQSFSIDKKAFFDEHLQAVKKRYVDNSLARLKGESDLIKHKILQRITDYATGKSESLTLADITKSAYEQGKHLSRLFARDQMQRFNKACTLATFEAAGVKKVKWATCNDARVRNKSYTDKKGVFHRAHTELQGKVFAIDNLPIEIDDYNCRCGLVPVEWENRLFNDI